MVMTMATIPTKMNSLPFQVNKNMEDIANIYSGNIKLKFFAKVIEFDDVTYKLRLDKSLENNKLYIFNIKTNLNTYSIDIILSTIKPRYHGNTPIFYTNIGSGGTPISIELIGTSSDTSTNDYLQLVAYSVLNASNVTSLLYASINSIEVYELIYEI